MAKKPKAHPGTAVPPFNGPRTEVCFPMRHLLFAIGLACALLVSPQPGRAGDLEVKKLKDKIKLQDSDEVKKLKDKIEILEARLELLKKENELLKKENRLLEKEAGKKGGGSQSNDTADKPSATVEDIEFVLDKVICTGKGVTIQVMATNSKKDTSLFITSLEAVDDEGTSYKVDRVNGRPLFFQVKLREGIKAKITLTLPTIPAGTTKLSLVEIRGQVGMLRGGGFGPGVVMKGTERSKTQSIQFKKVRLPAKKKGRK
jgi:hypothetical protein